MDIAAKLRSYDGKRVAPFQAVAEAVRHGPEAALPELLDLAESHEAALQVGATWVVKRLAEGGLAVQGVAAERLVGLLQGPLAPDAVLHVLQTLPHVDVPAAQAEALRRTLLALLDSRRAFVRAWAYNGLGVLAARDPGLRGEVETLFERAEATETAAVRARIRHARVGMG